MIGPLISKDSEVSNRTLRQFAGAWLVFFLTVATHQGLARGHQRLALVLAVMAIVVGVVGLIRPAAIRWIFGVCMTLAFPIGWLVSHIMLLLMFFAIVTPVALFFRFMGRDLLRRKHSSDRLSYWTQKEMPQKVSRYFRPF